MQKWSSGVLLMMASLLVACNDDDEKSEKEQARDDCQVFAETWCNQAVGCLSEVGSLPSNQRSAANDTCVDIAAKSCPRAIGVSSKYDKCLRDIKAMPCSTWDVETTEQSSVPKPKNCNQVILLEDDSSG